MDLSKNRLLLEPGAIIPLVLLKINHGKVYPTSFCFAIRQFLSVFPLNISYRFMRPYIYSHD
jgi:hypothetical protein